MYCDTPNTNNCVCLATYYWAGAVCGNFFKKIYIFRLYSFIELGYLKFKFFSYNKNYLNLNLNLKVPKVSYSQSCTTAQCDNTIGLICSVNTCNCPSTKFWNGTACRKIKTTLY